MNNITINKVRLDEIQELQSISKQSFFETFADSNSEANMQKYLEESFAIDKLTAELSNPDSKFYFAKQDNTIVGYLKINFGSAQTELKDKKALEIERIYVLKNFHGKEVGQILYNTALDAARQSDAEYLWLGVWEENPRAISFYKKNGFVEFDRHVFKLGDDEQTDIMMRLQLDKK